jgi:hypothetical protein
MMADGERSPSATLIWLHPGSMRRFACEVGVHTAVGAAVSNNIGGTVRRRHGQPHTRRLITDASIYMNRESQQGEG